MLASLTHHTTLIPLCSSGCPPLHPPMSWLACLTCAPPLPIHQDCSCISHTQVQPLDIEEHYEDTSHQFLVSSPQTLSVQREASPWCYFIIPGHSWCSVLSHLEQTYCCFLWYRLNVGATTNKSPSPVCFNYHETPVPKLFLYHWNCKHPFPGKCLSTRSEQTEWEAWRDEVCGKGGFIHSSKLLYF